VAGIKDRRILRGAPKLISAAQSGLMPEKHGISLNTPKHKPEPSAQSNIHQVGRVAIVQQRVGPHKFHIRCKLQDKQSTERQQKARCRDSNKKRSRQRTSRKEE
jgi:hypothetical protein